KDRRIADQAVVGDMAIGHDPVVVADPGNAAALHRAAVDGAELPDDVAVADLEQGRLALVLLVLRILAYRGELEDPVTAADPGRPADHHVRSDPGIVADLDVGADDGVGTDRDIRPELGRRVDDRFRIDHWSTSLIAQRTSHSAASCPSTSARASNRSEEHTSELQSRENLVCRLLLEKKKGRPP